MSGATRTILRGWYWFRERRNSWRRGKGKRRRCRGLDRHLAGRTTNRQVGVAGKPAACLAKSPVRDLNDPRLSAQSIRDGDVAEPFQVPDGPVQPPGRRCGPDGASQVGHCDDDLLPQPRQELLLFSGQHGACLAPLRALVTPENSNSDRPSRPALRARVALRVAVVGRAAIPADLLSALLSSPDSAHPHTE